MKKRILALLLAAVLVSCLTACGGSESTAKPGTPGSTEKKNDSGADARYQRMEAEAVTSKYAYKAEYIDIPVDTGYLGQSCVSGNTLYFSANVVNGKESYTDPETGETVEYDTYEDVLFRMDLTTRECLPVEGVLEAGGTPEDNGEGWEYNSYIQGSAAGPDDSLWLSIQRNSYRFNIPEGVDAEENQYNYDYYEAGETTSTLVRVLPDGTIDKVIDVGAQNEDDGPVADTVIGGFYMGNFFVDSNGYIYACDYETVLVWDSEGTRVMEMDVGQYGGLVQYSADKVGVIEYGETRRFRAIDPVKKDFGETVELPPLAYSILPGDDVYDFYYEYNSKIYGYIAETQTADKVVDWLECDVDDQNMSAYSMLPDGRVFAMTQSWRNEKWETKLILLERVDAATLPQKQTLVLACAGLDYNMRSQIVRFNQKNQKYRIVVRDYSEYATEDDYTAGLTKLTTEIASGVMPDLLATSGLPVKQYAAKGLLRDLWPIIDADSDISREDFVSEVLDALSVDDKLYELPTSFTLSAVAGLEKVVGEYETWTLEDVSDAMTKLKEDATIFSPTMTRDTALYYCVGQNISAFVDWENGTCNFDCDEFKSILEFVKQFQESFDYDNYEYASPYSRMRSGEQLLTNLSFYGFDELYAQFKAMDDQPCFVGYPTTSTATPVRSTFSCSGTLAITAACADVDAAWSLIRAFLADDYQNEQWNLPIMQSAFDAKLAEAMEQEFYTDPETGEQVEQSKGGIGYGNDEMIEIYAVTPEQRDIFMELLHSTTVVESTDQSIMEIVTEVTGSYFADEKSLEETVQIIQNRVNLYVMEQS